MNAFNKPVIGFIIVVMVLNFTGCGSKEVNNEEIKEVVNNVFTKEELREDFMKLRKFVEEKHPKLYIEDSELEQLFDKQYSLLNKDMGELEYYRILSPIISELRCGHTHITVSKKYEQYMRQNGRYLPLMVKLIDNKLYVLENLSSVNIEKGSEIISINGKKAEDIVRVLLENLTADGYNLTKKYYIINNWFNGIFYNYVDNSDEFKIKYRDPKELQIREATVSSIRDVRMDMTALSIYFISRSDKDTYYGEIFDDYAVLTIKSFNIDDIKGYKRFISDFFQKLSEKNVENLILDLRGNWGGPPTPAVFLYSYLNDNPTPFYGDAPFYYFLFKREVKPATNCFKGKIYTLIDGGSFSTTGHLISLLKHHGISTFVGEESGGGAVVTDMGRSFKLKNTGLRVYCSTGVFKAAAQVLTDGRGIIPDYRVVPTVEDYLNKRDVEMDFTKKLIKGDNQ